MSTVSKTLKFIYIRVPRTASTSFTHYLTTSFPNQISDIGRQHSSALEVSGELNWSEFYTFGFIRNPWEWLVSVYNANLSEGAWGKETLPGCVITPTQRANITFGDWVRTRQTTSIDWLSDREGNLLVDDVRLFEDFIQESKLKVSDKKHPHYKVWYTPELADYVGEKCKRKIETGNYNF